MCPVCKKQLSHYEPYDIIDGERVHVKCLVEKENIK